MKVKDRQKMCSNCDGRVAIDSLECPYCGTDFPEGTKQAAAQGPLFKNQTLQDSLASLYTPPYSQPKKNVSPEPTLVQEPELPQEEETGSQEKGTFWALFALIVAGNLFTIGMLQFFFSDHGLLRLEWDSGYWFLYCLIALPLAYFGLKQIPK